MKKPADPRHSPLAASLSALLVSAALVAPAARAADAPAAPKAGASAPAKAANPCGPCQPLWPGKEEEKEQRQPVCAGQPVRAQKGLTRAAQG